MGLLGQRQQRQYAGCGFAWWRRVIERLAQQPHHAPPIAVPRGHRDLADMNTLLGQHPSDGPHPSGADMTVGNHQ